MEKMVILAIYLSIPQIKLTFYVTTNRGFGLNIIYIVGFLFIPIKVIHIVHRLIHRQRHEISIF